MSLSPNHLSSEKKVYPSPPHKTQNKRRKEGVCLCNNFPWVFGSSFNASPEPFKRRWPKLIHNNLMLQVITLMIKTPKSFTQEHLIIGSQLLDTQRLKFPIPNPQSPKGRTSYFEMIKCNCTSKSFELRSSYIKEKSTTNKERSMTIKMKYWQLMLTNNYL